MSEQSLRHSGQLKSLSQINNSSSSRDGPICNMGPQWPYCAAWHRSPYLHPNIYLVGLGISLETPLIFTPSPPPKYLISSFSQSGESSFFCPRVLSASFNKTTILHLKKKKKRNKPRIIREFILGIVNTVMETHSGCEFPKLQQMCLWSCLDYHSPQTLIVTALHFLSAVSDLLLKSVVSLMWGNRNVGQGILIDRAGSNGRRIANKFWQVENSKS